MIKESIKTFKFVKELSNLRGAVDEVSRAKSQEYLSELLNKEGGILLKMAQYMGTKNDDLLKIVKPEFTENRLGLGPQDIKKILESHFPENYKKVTDISSEAFHASVGQVNCALINGNKVAIKTQYPNIKKTLKEQLKLLKLLPVASNYSSVKKWGVEFSAYQKMIEGVLEKECNYEYEIQELKRWNDFFSHNEHIVIPKTYTEFESSEIYIQEYIEGAHVDTLAKDWDKKDRKLIGQKLCSSFFEILFKERCFQGDTNFGNYLFIKDKKQVALIDFGQTVFLDSKIISALILALKSEIKGEEYSKLGLLVELGFDLKKLSHLNFKIDLLVDILLEPLVADYAFDLKDWKLQENLDLLLGEDKWWFRSAGSTDFFLLMKAFMGLKNLLIKIDTKVYFRKILIELLDSLTISGSIPTILIDNKYKSVPKGKFLTIELYKNGLKTVDMSMPFNALFDLEEYLDDDIKEKIKNENIDLNEVLSRAMSDGGQVKEVLKIEDKFKKIIISIANKKTTH